MKNEIIACLLLIITPAFSGCQVLQVLSGDTNQVQVEEMLSPEALYMKASSRFRHQVNVINSLHDNNIISDESFVEIYPIIEMGNKWLNIMDGLLRKMSTGEEFVAFSELNIIKKQLDTFSKRLSSFILLSESGF
jgi:hypothetical protein